MSLLEQKLLPDIAQTMEMYCEKLSAPEAGFYFDESLDYQPLFLHAIMIAYFTKTPWGIYISDLVMGGDKGEELGYRFLPVPEIMQPRECIICQKLREFDIAKTLRRHSPTCSEYCKGKWDDIKDTLYEAVRVMNSRPTYTASVIMWTAFKFLVPLITPAFIEKNGEVDYRKEISYTPLYTLFDRGKDINPPWWLRYMETGKILEDEAGSLFNEPQLEAWKEKNPNACVRTFLEDLDSLLHPDFKVGQINF